MSNEIEDDMGDSIFLRVVLFGAHVVLCSWVVLVFAGLTALTTFTIFKAIEKAIEFNLLGLI